MRKIAYLGMDVHSRNCELGQMDVEGNYRALGSFPTSERNIVEALKGVKAKEKYLALEEWQPLFLGCSGGACLRDGGDLL